MSELAKEDLIKVLEVALLNFEEQPLYTMLNYKLNTKHIQVGKEVLELIKQKW